VFFVADLDSFGGNMVSAVVQQDGGRGEAVTKILVVENSGVVRGPRLITACEPNHHYYHEQQSPEK